MIIDNTISNSDLAHQSEGRELNGRATLLSNETLTFEPDSKAEGLLHVSTSPNFPSPLVHQDEISIDSDGCNNIDSNHGSPYGSRCSSINNFGDVISNTVVSANISPSIINRSKTDRHFSEWDNLIQRETELLQRLKRMIYGNNLLSPQRDVDLAAQDSAFEADLNTFLQQKSILLQTYETQLLKKETKSPKQCESPPPSSCLSPGPEMSINQPALFVVQQPPDIVIANRYISPPPILEIRSNGMESEKGKSRTFIITVTLCYNQLNTPAQEISKTIDKKQDILQGIRRLTLSLSNQSPKTRQTYVSTTFPKLKVTEVTSKHKHQSFCLLFTLEEYSPSGECIVLHKIKTSPFQVLSRPSARSENNNGKRKAESDGADTPSPPKHKTVKVSAISPPNESGVIPDTPAHYAQMESMHLQDITELLTLPQKEAAHKLGISESMLCKRFKESTQRKWPYRYLLKLDKVIKILESQDKDGTISEEDRMKLNKLGAERVQCLHPVKIRISPNESVLNLNLNNNNNNLANSEKKPQLTSPINTLSSLASQSFIQNNDSNNSISDKDSDSESEDQELESHEEFLLETLELLKTQKPLPSTAQPQAVA